MRSFHLLRRCVVPAAALLATACSAAFDGRTYHGHGFVFSVPAPPTSWEMLRVKESALTFDDPATGAMIAVNGRCDRDGEDVPLRSLTKHLFFQFSAVDVHSEDVMPFDGREAMRSDVSAKLDGVERRLVVWVMKKDKCVYDLWYIARPDRFGSGIVEFDAWAKGFSARRDP
ncbi:MAG: hypothetical protein U0414_19430 [Polyangiaceae bacterium]